MGHLYMQITSIFSQVPKKTEPKKKRPVRASLYKQFETTIYPNATRLNSVTTTSPADFK